jgi:hypothetical protein
LCRPPTYEFQLRFLGKKKRIIAHINVISTRNVLFRLRRIAIRLKPKGGAQFDYEIGRSEHEGERRNQRRHTAKILRLSMDLPIVIENVDSEEKINAFLPTLEEMMSGGMVTLEHVQVVEYRHAERNE